MYRDSHHQRQDRTVPPVGQEQIKGQHQEDCEGTRLEDLPEQALTGHPAFHHKGSVGSHQLGEQVTQRSRMSAQE